jgi:hypothetical protein
MIMGTAACDGFWGVGMLRPAAPLSNPQNSFLIVIAGLDPAIHRLSMMDARVKPAHDEPSWQGETNG